MNKVLLPTLAFVVMATSAVQPSEIRVLGTQSMVLVWNDVGTIFQQQTGHKVVMTPHIAGGETID